MLSFLNWDAKQIALTGNAKIAPAFKPGVYVKIHLTLVTT